jgi:osmotically inducible lipoprotein OsmB
MHTLSSIQRNAARIIAISALVYRSGCAGMSEREKSTAIGAGAGAIGGSILTGGSAAGAIGGAAIGGVIGHKIKK